MATTKSTKTSAKTSRYNELKKMLEDRRRQLMSDVQGRIRDVRGEGSKDREVLDQGESLRSTSRTTSNSRSFR